MKELQRGKYELPSNWSIEDVEWIVKYDTIEKGKAVTKTLPLHPNCYNKAKVGEPCTFHIENAQNLRNGGEWESFAVVGETNLQLNQHMFEQIMAKSKVGTGDFGAYPPTDLGKLLVELSAEARTTKHYTQEEVKGILQETLKKLKNGK